MKIKPVRKTNKVMLELDEFYVSTTPIKAELIDLIAHEFAGRRMAYNMWEFENRETADKFIFMYRLKYANQS
jgi:hypothetical protein